MELRVFPYAFSFRCNRAKRYMFKLPAIEMQLPMFLNVKWLSEGQIARVTFEHGAGGLIVYHTVSVQLCDLRELGLADVTLVAAL
ncbi:hypothetical protein DPMN_184474 [Dreissena polymorpha]|uniref:Uncharacterized protein n=1 Tax=Dreissena polymorpha TaxID=45954 RepID=A0A9D4DJB2_DREPO|nr:hypothetical protein DPMN_184474 [Dreissena polymorpha]